MSKMTYDGQGRVKEQLTYATKEPAEIIIKPRELSSELTQQQRDILASKKAKLDIRGALIGQVINTYNTDGEMQQIQQFGRTEENLFQNATLEFNASHPLDYYLSLDVGEIINVAHFYSNPSDLRYVSQTLYSNLNEGGMATATQITEYGEKSGDADITRNFTRSYQLRDNWLETKAEGAGYATTGKVSPGSTSSIYDSNGNRKEINEINDNTPDETITRRMLFAADGTLLKKMEGKKGKLTLTDFLTGNGGFTQEAYSYHFTSNGNYLGEVAEGKKSTNLSQQFGKITSTLKNQHFSAPDLTSGTPASNYQVRSGDTLKNIALMFYGNSDYWYLIANTNGLTSDPTAPLVAGMALDIPARATQENTGTSFKPMQLEQIIGDTNPYLPYIPPPPKCNAIAMIVMIAVTVMVSVATSGALSSTAVGAFGGGFGAGFIGGVAGSVAGQSVGKVLGVVEHFSLKQALASGITQGFATGAAETLKASQWAKDAGLVVEAGKHAGELEAAGKMLLAATSVGVNWAANRLVGNNSVSFSWRNVVTSAAAAGAMHGIESIGVGNADDTVGSMLRSFSDSNPVTGGTVQNIISSAVSWNVKRGIYGNHFKDEHWNFKEVARDAFGNALGSAIALKIIPSDGAESAKQAEQKGQDAYEKAKSEGKSEIEAQQVRREAELSEIPDEKRKQLDIKNDSDKVRIKFIGETSWFGEKDNTARSFSMSLNTENFDSQNKELIRFITDEGLWRDKKMVDLATYAMSRVEDYWSQDNIDRRANKASEEAAARAEARYNHINRNSIAAQQRQRETAQKLDAMNKQKWEIEQARAKMTTLEKTQLVLDVIGTTDAPILSQLAELGSAGISAYQGDYVGAALSIGSMAPGLGKLAEVQKMARWAEKLTPVAKTINAVEKVATVVKESRIAAKLDDVATKVIDFSKSLDEMPRNMDVADLSRVPNPEFRGECFVSGTLIHTKAGMLPIEQIQVGDWVYARNEKTFELSFKKVLQLFNVANKIVHSLVIKSNGVTETITATDEHPIYVQGLGWTPTKSLEPGCVIELIDGSVGVLVENNRHVALETVFNFEVAEFHTYFVGAVGVWVHNSSVMNFSDWRKEELPVKQRVEMYRDAKDTKTISSEYGIAGRDVLVQALGKVGDLAKTNEKTSLSEAKKLVREYKEMLRIVERTENRFIAGALGDTLSKRQEEVAKNIPWLKKVFEGSLRDRIFKDEFKAAKVLGKFGDFAVTQQGAKGIDIFRVLNGKSSGQIGLDLTTQASWAKHVTRYKDEHKILLPLLYR
ncbi:MAG: hypothetical protein J0M22_17960 [Gammaproteobacteria bacterium]|nr:hypothetical protein [Gammaproteobacteria bacterium]